MPESRYYILRIANDGPHARIGVFNSLSTAEAEARRLCGCTLNMGQEFIVARAVNSIKKIETPYIRTTFSRKG